MTELTLGNASNVAARAHQLAEAAAASAGVTVRTISAPDELTDAYELYKETWRPDASNQSMTLGILRVLAKTGNYVSGAFVGSRLVGMSVGFCGQPDQRSLHSHITGVSSSMQGRKVGQAIKLHQRAWALESSMHTITWTVDPLVRRNAFFNIVKLGAVPTEYLPNFYGQMDDAINGSDASDRLLITWDLDSEIVGSVSPGSSEHERPLPEATELIVTDANNHPHGSAAPQSAVVAVATPDDIESLRRTHPEAARAWRSVVRDCFMSEFAAGSRVVGFDARGSYIFDRNQNSQKG
ncbi:GNAT family N-acetyltransferase [Paenarthrobacter sp. NPDC056912]|uniref:GNAT family N-acetyltransferase n=1 Tax=Paenarthrobacter sp. NPDC056912 TaxID=3345965 RepID=UPI00367102C0